MEPTITYKEGDIFKSIESIEGTTIYLPHVVNNQGAWGAGFVVPLGQKYPEAQKFYLESNKMLGSIGVTTDNSNVSVINMCAQTLVGERPLNYGSLSRCMTNVQDYILDNMAFGQSTEIHAPLFGSGLAGGFWPFIHELIRDIWTDSGIPVTIYYLKDKCPPTFPAWLDVELDYYKDVKHEILQNKE